MVINKSIREEMKNLMLNLIDFIRKRINAPPYRLYSRLLLIKHEKVYHGNIVQYFIESKKIKENMRKTVLLLGLMLSTVISFAQQATIDGDVCTSADLCKKYVCENSTIDLLAGITSGPLDSVVWRQRIFDPITSTWGSWQTVGTTIIITVPVGMTATVGYVYRYQLIAYSGGNAYFALSDVYVNARPTATLLSDYTTICAGSLVNFTASAGGTTYDFKVGGVSQYSGANSFWSSSTLANGDQVTVTVSNGSCSATSTPIIMTVHPRPDATSVTPSSTCNGEAMDWTYQGLTGTGPWTVSFWNPTHTIQYGPDYNVSSSNGSLPDVPIPYGTSNVHFKIEDIYCPNF